MVDRTDERNVAEQEEQGGAVEPPKVVQQVQEFVASFARSGPVYHPIFGKFGPEHVTQFLRQTHEQDIGEQRLRKSNRWFHLTYVLTGVVLFALLTWLLLPEQADLYLDILQGLAIFVGGGGGGYGLRAYQDSRRDS